MSQFEADTLPTPEGISELTGKVTVFLEQQKVDARAIHHVALVLEELLSNLVIHGQYRLPAKTSVTVEPAHVRVQIADRGVPFDPRFAPAPAFDTTPDDRVVGGLGLHLVRKLSSALEYATKDGENCTTITITRR